MKLVLLEIQSFIARINEAKYLTYDEELKSAYHHAELALTTLKEAILGNKL